MFAVRVQMRMGIGNLSILVAMGVDEVGTQQQLSVGEDFLRRPGGGSAARLQAVPFQVPANATPSSELYFRLAGGMMLFMRRYSTIWP